MDIKELLKAAIDAKIGGDQKAFTDAMKQAVAAKVGAILTVESDQAATPMDEGDYFVQLEEYEYNGELVDVELGINISHYQAPTPGNFSPQATDPSEFHGDPEELEWDVVSANIIDAEGNTHRLSKEESEQLTFNEREQEFIDSTILNKIQAKRDDDASDRY